MTADAVQYIICDARRYGDLLNQDNVAVDDADAKRKAEELSKRFNCRVMVLGVVAVVECPAIVPQWVRPLPM